MLAFIQAYGQAILFGIFIVVLFLLCLFMLFAHPKATCCSAGHIEDQRDPQRNA